MSNVTIICLCALAIVLAMIDVVGRSAQIGTLVFVILLGISMLTYLVTRIIRHGLTIVNILASVLFIITIISAVHTLTHLR